MKTIMLVCSAGMSTSLLVKKMQEAALKENEEYKIFAVGACQVDIEVKNNDIDLIMVGPQLRFKAKEFKNKFEPEIKVSVIDTVDYGMMDGQKVFSKAKEIIG